MRPCQGVPLIEAERIGRAIARYVTERGEAPQGRRFDPQRRQGLRGSISSGELLATFPTALETG
ncbi:hypothetical protein SAMN06266982_12144 [Propioniciclava tarda]|nr:hypothetical protein SAMN06266982_12144 [Propioniciclava tarda]